MAPHGTRFGYQLFEVRLHRQTTTPVVDFVSGTLGASGPTLIESFRIAQSSLEGRTRVGALTYRERSGSESEDDAISGDTKPAIRVLTADVVHDKLIRFEFRYGRIGSHDLAIAADELDDATLADKASTNEFRAFFYLPDSGDRAILVVENRGNLCPVDYLLKHLSFHFKDLDDARPSTESVGWWRLMAKGVADSERLDEVLRQGRGAALQLEKYENGGDGRRRTNSVTVRQDGLPEGKIRRVRALVYDWLNLNDPEPDPVGPPPGTSVQQVASLLDVNVIVDQFDDGAVVYDDGTGRTQTIRPHSVREVFVYPLAEGRRPVPREIQSDAEDRIRRLLPTLGIPLSI